MLKKPSQLTVVEEEPLAVGTEVEPNISHRHNRHHLSATRTGARAFGAQRGGGAVEAAVKKAMGRSLRPSKLLEFSFV